MEEARVYRDDGAMRILFGLSVIDLCITASIFIVLTRTLPLENLLNLVVSVTIAWFGGQLIAKGRGSLPVESIRQYTLWVAQPDLLTPQADPDARPLVYHPKEPA